MEWKLGTFIIDHNILSLKISLSINGMVCSVSKSSLQNAACWNIKKKVDWKNNEKLQYYFWISEGRKRDLSEIHSQKKWKDPFFMAMLNYTRWFGIVANVDLKNCKNKNENSKTDKWPDFLIYSLRSCHP